MTARAPARTAHNSELHCKVTRLHLLTTRINSLRPTSAIMNRTCKFCCSPCCLRYLAQLSVLGAKASPRTFVNVALVRILCERSKLKTTLLCTSLMMLLHIVLLLCGLYLFGVHGDACCSGLEMCRICTCSFYLSRSSRRGRLRIVADKVHLTRGSYHYISR
jgi:hypothetical protein